MEKDPNESRFLKIERKLNWVLAIGLFQCLALAFIIIWLFVSPIVLNVGTKIILLAALVGFLFAFRRRIPGWFGRFSRWFFAQIVEAEEKDAMKKRR